MLLCGELMLREWGELEAHRSLHCGWGEQSISGTRLPDLSVRVSDVSSLETHTVQSVCSSRSTVCGGCGIEPLCVCVSLPLQVVLILRVLA